MIFDGEENLEPIKWLVAGLIPAEGLGMLFGESDVGKTFNALNLTVAVASGQPWHGHPVTEGSVVFVETEGGRAFAMRKHAAKMHACIREDAKLPIVTIAEPLLFGLPTANHTPDPKGRAQVIQEAVAKRGLPPIRLAVIDTLAQNLSGDENLNADMTPFLRDTRLFLKHLTQGVAFGLLIHHPGHGDKTRGRGGSTLPADLDLIMNLKSEPTNRQVLTLSCNRMRDAERFLPLTLKLQKVEVSVKGKPILDAFDKPQTSLVVLAGREAVDHSVAEDAYKALMEAILTVLPKFPENMAVRTPGGLISRLKPILGKAVGHERVEPVLLRLEADHYICRTEGRTAGSRRWGKVDILADPPELSELSELSQPLQTAQSPTAGGSGPPRSGRTPAYLGKQFADSSLKSLDDKEIELSGSIEYRDSSDSSPKSQKVLRMRRKVGLE